MKSVCVCGAFRLKNGPRGGQEIKTTVLADELEKLYGKIHRIDTVGRVNQIFSLFRLLKALFKYQNLIILPAHNGLLLDAPWLSALNTIFHKSLHYVVIGGWLQDYLCYHKITAKSLETFDGIYVETSTMKNSLEKMGFKNVILLPNFKSYRLVTSDRLCCSSTEPYKLCTFSRVSEMKGIGTAADVVMDINRRFGRIVYTLDIFGPMEDCDIPWLAEREKNFTPEIQYKGVVPYDDCIDTLSNYFALLFPTKYYTEGIPGTIMDAYAAGVPVISSKWKSFSDVIEEGVTGYGYEFENAEAFREILIDIVNKPDMILRLKDKCLIKAKQYLPENVLPKLRLE